MSPRISHLPPRTIEPAGIWNALATRMAVIFTLALGLGSLVVFLVVPRALGLRALEAVVSRTDGLSVVTAERLSRPVERLDRAAVRSILDSLAASEPVRYVQVYSSSGVLVGSAGPWRFRGDRLWWREPSLLRDLSLYQTGAAIHGPAGDSLGHVRLGVSLAAVDAEVAAIRRLVGLVSAVTFLLGVLAVVVVTHLATRPVREIARAAERIAAGDLSSRVPVRGSSEVRVLARGFNHMARELGKARDGLADAKARLERILDSLPAPVAVFDEGLRCVYVNRAGIPEARLRERMTGHPVREMWAATGAGPDAVDLMEAAVRQAFEADGVVTWEVEERRSGGSATFLYMASPTLDPGGDRRVVGYRIDITDWRDAERALEESEERLRQAQKMEAVGRLAGGIAHDFNNILTSIGGFAELLLLEEGEGSPRRPDLEQIRDGTARAARLTQQLLAFSRKQVLVPQVLDLNRVLREMEAMLRRLVPEHVCLTTDPGADLPPVRADAGQIEQVLMNLVVNAVDAMPCGGALRISTRAVRDTDGAPRVRLTVLDTGVGMDEDTRRLAFEPFFTTKAPGQGTGLGLSTVYGIVQQSGGTVELLSRAGRGTVFRVELPRHRGVRAVEEESRESDGTALEGGSETILLVEDDDAVRRIAARALRRHGYGVREASEPRRALEILAEGRDPVDLLLTDVVMPGMSGPELARRVATARPDLRVLYMSGYSEEPPPLEREGRSAFLPKPFTAVGLVRAVREHLDRGARTDGVVEGPMAVSGATR